MAETNRDDALEHLAELERRSALGASSDVERNLSRQRFMARADEELERPAWRFPALRWAAPVAAVVCLAAVLLLWRSPVLTFEVAGAELSGKYVSAPEGRAAELRFSDASKLVATPGSRLRVEETTALGARVLLERGPTQVQVTHKRSTAWSFAAGPYDVRVTGTRFDLAWDPARETCDLVLHEGSVEVRGPTGSGPVVVRAGQRFAGDAKQRTMQVLELAQAVPSAPAPAIAEPKAPESPAADPTSPSAPVAPPAKSASTEARESWPARIAQGKFKEIVSDAEARGISTCLSGCTAADLRALADAARYTGNITLAEQTLTSLRQRFPGAQGSEAAFQLGRLHEKRGAMAVAQGFFDTYLREAPGGAFAAEALAGKLRAVRATRGRAAAQPLAREYLKRFPKGVHVQTAREILGDE